jgi:hypothetical protein
MLTMARPRSVDITRNNTTVVNILQFIIYEYYLQIIIMPEYLHVDNIATREFLRVVTRAWGRYLEVSFK